MRIAMDFWQGSTRPASSRLTALRRLFNKMLPDERGPSLPFRVSACGASTDGTSQCTNPVCTPGKACALYRCADPRPCWTAPHRLPAV